MASAGDKHLSQPAFKASVLAEMLEVDAGVFRAMLDWLSEEIEAGQESEASPSCADLEDAELHIIAAQSADDDWGNWKVKAPKEDG